MIIDFHTHIFPEQISQQAIQSLESESHIKAKGIATYSGILQNMKDNAIDYSVILPVVTKPSQFFTVNEYAIQINKTNHILSFGGIHPDNTDITGKLEFLKEKGLQGVKLHPDYQGPTFIDDEKYVHIIRECIRLELCVVIHSGIDVGRPSPIHCPPDRIRILLDTVLKDCQKDSKLIFAHMGGMLQWDLVEYFLAGENIYFDLAYCNILGNSQQISRIIQKHGADKILYGTDYPWTSPAALTRFVHNLPLTQEEKEQIFYKNAASLLNLTH